MNNDVFDTYLTKSDINTKFLLTYSTYGLTNLGSSTHATLEISKDSLQLIDDGGKTIVKLKPDQVLSIKDNLSEITINTESGNLNINFYNVRKGGIKLFLLGSFLSSGSKESPYSAVVQGKCKQAINALMKNGYSASLSSKRSS